MFTISGASACVIVGTFLASITHVTCDYDGDQAAGYAVRSLDANGLCNGGRCSSENSNGISGAMWFGPRLGRKRRSDEKIETTDEDISAIADAINGGPWTFFEYRGVRGKRHTIQFTPRLGRELKEDFLQKHWSYDFDKNRLLRYLQTQDHIDSQRQLPPYPHQQLLGGNLPFTPSPRLGRDLRYVRKA